MIFIALGANLPSRYGTPEETLLAAYRSLEEAGLRVVKRSSIWLSAPVPVSDQPWYRNAVCAVECDLLPDELLRLLKGIERDFGRVETERNAPRVLDLDIVAYGDELINVDGLHIPHPRMHERAFVLYPLYEIAPSWSHPVSKIAIADLISALPDGQDIQKMDNNDAKTG